MSDFDKAIFNERVMLILGAPRSGTTLLAAMLSAHNDIAVLMEDYFGSAFRILSKRVSGVKLCIPNQIELNENKIEKKVYRLFNFFIKVLNCILKKLNINPLGRINIRSSFSIRDYQHYADQVHIIGIIRQPEAAINSEKKRAKISLELAEAQWARAVDILFQLHEEDPSGAYITLVRFEELVTQPEHLLKHILDKLEIPYSDSVMDGFKHTPQYQNNSGISPQKSKSKNKEEDMSNPVFSRHPGLLEKYKILQERSCLVF